MWFKDEELYPRFLRSALCITVIQAVIGGCCSLMLKVIAWHPLYSLTDWLLCMFHWKTIVLECILASSVIAFGALNVRFTTVEKHICSTRFEKLCRALSPHCLQHVFVTMVLGGLSTYCYISLIHNFARTGSFFHSCFSLTDEFERSFVIGHGCFTGMMFSLKYFICNMYLLKFTLDQESKIQFIQRQVYDLVKDSFLCIIKAVHWYYIGFIIFGSPLKILTLSYLGNTNNENGSTVYSLINPKLFLVTITTGVMISYIWSLYLTIFNAFAAERCVFPIKVPVKGSKTTLLNALTSKDSAYMKYLAVLDLRLLSQHEPQRREQIFAISTPGGHPHEWNSISKVCITSLQDFVSKLYNYSFSVASSGSKAMPTKESLKQNSVPVKPQPNLSDKIYCRLLEKPVFSYFFDELPNAKLMKLFATSQPFIWMLDALGYLISFSYTEDKYGVIQQSLPEIIRLLLDLKMAEEKMPVGLVGIRTYVRDPQGRYEHIHQRLSLKTTVHNALSRIASTFKDDLNGIYLPEEYQKYLQRYLSQKKLRFHFSPEDISLKKVN